MNKRLIPLIKMIPIRILSRMIIFYVMRSIYYFDDNKKSTTKTLLVLNHIA